MPEKLSWQDLAVFGAEPLFSEKLHVGRPNIGDRDHLMQRIQAILDNRWLTNNGPFVQEFESRIADLLKVKHCIAVCNGTVALEIAIRAVGLRGEVIIPSFTFIATAHALQWQEITPVFADIDPRTHNLDPASVERMITPRTTAIMGVHLWGRPCNIEDLTEIAQRHHLKLLFDASHAFGCSYRSQMIGSFGDAEVFSFHATKFVNCLEGGAIVTNNDELAAKIRLMKNFGFAGFDNVSYIGTNGKMNEMSAAMGLTSLDGMDGLISINQANFDVYRQELADVPGVTLIRYDDDERSNYQYVVAEIDEEKAHIHRDQIMKILWAENILARRYFYPGCHRMLPYRSYFPNAGLLLPETEKLCNKVLVLPTGQSIDRDCISKICNIIRMAVMHGKEIALKLAQIDE